MSEGTKSKIKHIVDDYEKFLSSEYQTFLLQKKEKIPLNRYAELKGADIFHRHLFDIPETLYNILRKTLIEGEWEEFTSKSGQRWFTRTFNEFAIPQKL